MTFLQIYKARLRFPRRRASLSNMHQIADANAYKFARAFMALTTGFFDDVRIKGLKEAFARGDSAEQILSRLPFYEARNPDSDTVWAKLSDQLTSAYLTIFNQSGSDALAALRLNPRYRLAKARGSLPVVPPNPRSLQWIKTRSSKLVRDVSDSQRDMIRDVIHSGYSRGLRAEAMVRELRDHLGLLPRDARAVENLRTAMGDGGADKETIETAVYSKRVQLLEQRASVIARTETITAANQGRQDAWVAAQEAGELPAEVYKQWSAASASDKACPICLELDGQTVGLNEQFYSDELGESLDGPTAHPACRCVTYMVDTKEG